MTTPQEQSEKEMLEKLRKSFDWEGIFGKNSEAQKAVEELFLQSLRTAYKQGQSDKLGEYWKQGFAESIREAERERVARGVKLLRTAMNNNNGDEYVMRDEIFSLLRHKESKVAEEKTK